MGVYSTQEVVCVLLSVMRFNFNQQFLKYHLTLVKEQQYMHTDLKHQTVKCNARYTVHAHFTVCSLSPDNMDFLNKKQPPALLDSTVSVC